MWRQLFSVAYKHKEWWFLIFYSMPSVKERNKAMVPNVLSTDPVESADFQFPHKAVKSMVTELKFNIQEPTCSSGKFFGSPQTKKRMKTTEY